jgi:hypothetical protein
MSPSVLEIHHTRGLKRAEVRPLAASVSAASAIWQGVQTSVRWRFNVDDG